MSTRASSAILEPSFSIQLFVTGDQRSSEIERRVRELLDLAVPSDYSFEVVDVLSNPDAAELAQVLMTPTLLVRSDGSERRLVGDPTSLAKLQLVLAGIG